MSQFLFGSGSIYATPLVDATGAAITYPTPVKFLACQDISSDISFDVKTLHGQNQFPLAVARGKGKISVKAKHGQVNGALYNNCFFGQTVTTGQDQYYQDFTADTIPATPYQIIKTPANNGIWTADMGVRNAAGVPMTRVAMVNATPPTTGQYSISQATIGTATFATSVMTVATLTSGYFAVGQAITSAGVTAGTYITSQATGTPGGAGTYNLSTAPGTITPAQAVTGAGGCYRYAAADTGLQVYSDYRYTVTTGNQIAIANQLLGSTPTVALDIVIPYAGKMLTIKFPNAVAGKMALATKLDDFSIPEVDFDCFVDATGNVGTIGFGE